MELTPLREQVQSSLMTFEAFRLDLEKTITTNKQEAKEKESLSDHLKNILADLLILGDFIDSIEEWNSAESSETDPINLIN